MATTVQDNPNQHRYELLLDGEVTGFVEYQLDDGRISLTHTEVDDAHAGKGLGRQLVTGVLADVEERGLGVVPQCPYVRRVIDQDRERHLHLVPEDVRVSFDLEA